MLQNDDLYVLSYYRACELAGSVLFGRLALHTEIDDIRIPMTHHCLEEAEHAYLWTQTIKKLGAIPMKVTHTYQTEYGKEFGMPKNILEIFCLTQVFEKRTMMHFEKHLKMPNVHSEIKQTLQKMIDDETGHIGWVREELNKYEKQYDAEEVTSTMKRLEEIDRKVYDRIMSQDPYNTYFANK